MYFAGLHKGQVIILNYYMLNIMFHLIELDSEENVLHIQCIISCIKIIKHILV